MKDVKTLILDIETKPILAYVWGLKDQFINLDAIKEDWSVMAWAAKWLGKSEIMYRDMRGKKDLTKDQGILEPIWHLLDEADVVITQNGASFDGPKLNARFIHHGMQPPSAYRHLDTYRIARNAADFTSNKLEYLTDKLCVKYKKLKHKKFPGFSLWKECMKDNKAAWNEMKLYNIHDVLSTEELYTKLCAWAPKNAPVITTSVSNCGRCGENGLMANGVRIAMGKPVQRWRCNRCGANSTTKIK